MQVTKVIRGTPIYVYRKTQYLDKPDNLIPTKLEYSEVENITYVYLKKRTHIVEILCSLIILICVIFSLTFKGQSITVNYNNLVIYYNEQLYVNWHNPDASVSDVEFSLCKDNNEIYNIVLSPGETVTTIPITNCSDKYDLLITAEWLGKEYSTTEKISVDIKEAY